MRRPALLAAALLLIASGATAGESLLGRWNGRDLSQFEIAGPGGFEVSERRIRAVPLERAGAFRTLRLPLARGVTRVVIRLEGRGSAPSLLFGSGRADPFVLALEVPTLDETTEVEIARASDRLSARVGGEPLATAVTDGAVRWVGLRVASTASLTVRDVLWFGEREVEPEPAAPVTEVRGTIAADAVWSGEVHLVGDVVVPRGVKLEIRGGTRVLGRLPEGGTDGKSPYDLSPSLAEIHVLGRIEALGAPGSPVVLGEVPETEDWKERGRNAWSFMGVVIHRGADAGSRFLRCEFRGALGGIQCAGGKPEIQDCLFLRCSIGVGAATVWSNRRGDRIVLPRQPAPRISRCRFVHCETGVHVDLHGRPTIDRSVFLGCGLAVGRWKEGYSHAITGLGALIDRSDFLLNEICVQGSGSVRNSILLRNDLVFSSSRFHRLFADTIDRYHRSCNVYFDNGALANDDIPFGEGSRFEDPRYVGPIEDDPALRPDALALSDGSPVRGAASDGGDPGSAGRLGPGRGEGDAAVRPGGRPLGPWLIPGPAGFPFDSLPRELGGRRPGDPGDVPQPGQRQGALIWSLFPTEDGLLHLRAPPAESVVLIAGVRSDAAGSARLTLGLAGRVVRCAWNGEALPAPTNRRRFEIDDVGLDVAVREGVNLLALEVVPDRPVARISAVLSGDEPGSRARWHYPFEDPPPRAEAAVKRVTAAVARRGGAETGTVRVFFGTRVGWRDATDPATYRVVGPGGPIGIEAGAIEYDVDGAKVEIGGLPLEKGTEYTVTVAPVRDCWGRVVEPGRADWTARTR